MSTVTEVISHWSTLIENFQSSSQVFYDAVTKAVEKREIPDAKIDKVSWNEYHLLSAKREYLRVSCRNDFYFAICGAPFGTGFFISWWLLQPPEGCLVTMFSGFPVLSAFAQAMVKPWTYYRLDTAQMFQSATHAAVLEVMDSITSAQGLRALPEADRKPIMKEFFR